MFIASNICKLKLQLQHYWTTHKDSPLKNQNQAEGKQNPRQRQRNRLKLDQQIWNQTVVQKVDSEDKEKTYGAQGRRFWAEEMYNDQSVLERKKGRIKKNRKTVNPNHQKIIKSLNWTM